MLTNKIASAELRLLAAGDSDERISVLVQPTLPQRTIEGDPSAPGGAPNGATVRVGFVSLDEQALTERQIAEAGVFLEQILGTPPRWLGSARSFVARATPQQLRTIAGSPTIEAIWPNRQLRVHGSPLVTS